MLAEFSARGFPYCIGRHRCIDSTPRNLSSALSDLHPDHRRVRVGQVVTPPFDTLDQRVFRRLQLPS
jgi:hypothetical protein